MLRRLLAVLVGGLAVLPVTPALAAPANVTVRIEGQSTTLVPRTAIRTSTEAVVKDGDPSH